MAEVKSKGAVEAMEVAEASRETEWEKPSFVGQLFLGNLDLDLIHPFPEQPEADKAEADLSALRARTRELETAFDFRAHLHRQREFSELTFGPGRRTAGVVDHIRKELREIEAEPGDLREWVDVVILALDGAWRAGFDPDEIIDTLVTKQARNEARKWPGLAHDAARQGYRARSCGSLGRGVPPRADGVRKTRELSRSRTPYLIWTA